jgi:uracil phosphoribosyltransferase
MVINLSQDNSILCDWIAEIRDQTVQADRMRFRHNLERIGEIAGYEISRKLPYVEKEIQTPLGISPSKLLKNQPVLATILRAGLPLHQGLLRVFDKADSAFISAFRKHDRTGAFEISMGYITSPDLEDRILIISDPMLATGSSMVKTVQQLRSEGNPAEIHIVTAIACTVGIEYLHRALPTCKIWCGAIDDELTAKGYIVPGLGDAGDLSFGNKLQF